MSMTQEALRMALEAFEAIPEEIEGWIPDKCTDAVIAIKEALAQTQEPPQRSESFGKPSAWVGLTNEEIDSYFEDHGWSPSKHYYPVIKDIEAKLKEKNMKK